MAVKRMKGKDYVKLLNRVGTFTVDVGIPKERVNAEGVQIAAYALAMETGVPSRNIPARSVFKTTLQVRGDEITDVTRRATAALLAGHDEQNTAAAVGGFIAAALRETQSTYAWKPIAPATVAGRLYKRGKPKLAREVAKGGAAPGKIAQPLMDTSAMHDAHEWRLRAGTWHK